MISHVCIFRMRGRSAGVYMPTCRPTSNPEYTYMAYPILYIFIDVDLFLALSLSMCRPADLPLILNIHTWLTIYIIYIDTYLYLAPTLFICRPTDPPIILNMHGCLFRMRVGSAGWQIGRLGLNID